jgi:hypothetical protein
MTNATTFGGANANTTNATCPRHIWISYVLLAAIERGVNPGWLQKAPMYSRIATAYHSGEPVWMCVDSMLKFWRGYELAKMEAQDGLNHIRAAATEAR